MFIKGERTYDDRFFAHMNKLKDYFVAKSILSVRGKLHTELKVFVEEQKAEPID